MYRLTCKNDWQKAEFYFRTQETMDKFKYVFSDHWCNLPWNEPEIVPDDYPLNDYWSKHIDDDPKVLAEGNLKWGFNSVLADPRNAEYAKPTPSMTAFIDGMVDRLTNEPPPTAEEAEEIDHIIEELVGNVDPKMTIDQKMDIVAEKMMEGVFAGH